MNVRCFLFAEEGRIAHFWKEGNSKKGSNNFKIEGVRHLRKQCNLLIKIISEWKMID